MQGIYTQFLLYISSTQTGEGYKVYGSNTAGMQGVLTTLYSSSYSSNGQCPQYLTLPLTYKYYIVTAIDNSGGRKPAADVLIQSIALKCGSSPGLSNLITPTSIPTINGTSGNKLEGSIANIESSMTVNSLPIIIGVTVTIALILGLVSIFLYRRRFNKSITVQLDNPM